MVKKGRPRTSHMEGEDSSKPEPEWASAKCLDDLMGPFMLVIPEGAEPLVITCQDNGNLQASSVGSLNLSRHMDQIEPNDVKQVFVGQSLIPGQFSIKSASGKYLSSNHVGKVVANKDAVGQTEEWIPLKTDTGFAFKNYQGQYWTFEPSLGTINALSETVSDRASFHVQCRALKPKSIKKLDPSTAEYESEVECQHEALLDERIKKKHDPYC